jgi:putative membrane protein
MAFIDDVIFFLFAISLSGYLLFYTILSIFFIYKKNNKNLIEYLKGASIPIGVLGACITLFGIINQVTWALPGSYNILFFDPFTLFGILLLSFSIVTQYKAKFEYIGIIGLIAGFIAIIYGISGYMIGLTQSPIDLLLMYLFYGIAGIFSYPMALILDRMLNMKKDITVKWKLIIAIFIISIFIASSLAFGTGMLAVYAHLLNPP